ncbi:MAG: hypothetical protein M0036_10245 [Desulfobacteraceae bacterium]|nr:hypothetical protein [Desulfobacteraceae bacterium]
MTADQTKAPTRPNNGQPNISVDDVQQWLGEESLTIKLLRRENAALRREISNLQAALTKKGEVQHETK